MKLQLQPIDTAPRDGTEVLVKLRGYPRLLCCKWGNFSQAWLIWDQDHKHKDCDVEGWTPMPDYELPPKPMTILAELEVNMHTMCGQVRNMHDQQTIQAAFNRAVEILRRRKGEVIE